MKPTADGKRLLGELILDARDRILISSWDEFADYLSRKTNLKISKDAIHNLVTGKYTVEPAARPVYALVQTKCLMFKNGQPVDSMDFVYQIIYGLIDAYGRPTSNSHTIVD